MNIKPFLIIALAAVFATASGCSKDDPLENETEVKDVDPNNSDDEIGNTTVGKSVTITFSSGSAAVDDSDFKGSYVKVSGAGVTVNYTGTDVVEYVLKGSTSDGFFKLYSERKQVIRLSGASITNKKGAAINNQSGKRTFVVLEGSNSLADGSSYSGTPKSEDEKAAFFSEGQLIFSGSGSLNVTASGKAAITSDDYLKFTSGTITATSSAGHALRGKDAVIIAGGTIKASTSADMKKAISTAGLCQVDGGNVTLSVSGSAGTESGESEVSGTACVKAGVQFVMNNGALSCTSTGSGGKGISTDGKITVTGGTIDVNVSGSNYGSSGSGKGGFGPGGPGGWGGPGGSSSSSGNSSSAKGIKADEDILISGGTITTVAKNHEALESKKNITIAGGRVYAESGDDAINCGEQYSQSGGYVYAYSTSNDGLDSNYGRSGAITVSGGVLIAIGTSSPEEGIDADSNSFLTFKGGTIFSSGGQQMGSSAPSCSQPTLYIQSFSIQAGYFTVTDDSGSVIMSCKVPRALNQNYSFISSSQMKSGSTYHYGVSSSAPSSPSTSWAPYYYSGGTASIPSGSFTASSGYTSKR